MIYNREFLLTLDKQKHKNIYAKITALNLQEYPIKSVEGRVTQGSINIDGASAVRRTCSLTFVVNDFDYSDYLWGFNTKFKLEIGVKNTIDPRYEDIIWFNQGIYIISSFNTSRSTNNFTISIQGKDKMSQLNGDVGGTINSSVDFGTIEEEDENGNWIIRKIPIKDIIRNMVHQYGGEPLHNIIINDIPDEGYELMEYRYDVPMYLYQSENSMVYDNATLDGTVKCTLVDPEGNLIKNTTLSELEPTDFKMLVDPLMGVQTNPSRIQIKDNIYTFAKIEYGQTAGYRKTPLTYAGDLIANIGETVTSILDKIKNMLGEFEYFYDLDGHFVFQMKQSFVNTMYSPIEESDNEQYVTSNRHSEASQYTFNDGDLITAFNNNPNIANLRNDFSIWGQRNGISGAQIPVHFRYAIDNMPTQYTTITVNCNIGKDGKPENENDFLAIQNYNKQYNTNLKGQASITYTIDQYDWREIIYQMALDYYKYNHLDDFELKVATANPHSYPFGTTGYEQYYIDLQGFWRDLYDPFSGAVLTSQQNNLIDQKDKEKDKEKIKELEAELLEVGNKLKEYEANYYQDGEHQYWHKNVYERPENLNFWFDFLDTEGELEHFSVKKIGSRPKAVNDTNIKAIYFKDTPNILFVKDEENIEDGAGYQYIQVPNMEQMFSISAQGKSAKNKLDELIYQHGYQSESATINCVPIYHLQPNIRVHLFDEKTHLDGDYIISKITIPLAYNGTMSLTATKAVETFL